MIVYPLAVSAFLDGDLDVLSDSLRLRLMVAGYNYLPTDQYLSIVPGGTLLGSGTLLSGKSIIDGALYADDVVIAPISAGSTVVRALLYQDTGVAATSRLIALIDRKADRVPLSILTNGGGFTLTWPAGKVLKL